MASHVNSSPPSIGWPARRINVTAALLLSVMHQFGIFLFFRPLYFRPRSEGGDTAAKITGLYAELAAHHHHQPPLSSAALFGSFFFFPGGSVDTNFISPPHPCQSGAHWVDSGASSARAAWNPFPPPSVGSKSSQVKSKVTAERGLGGGGVFRACHS